MSGSRGAVLVAALLIAAVAAVALLGPRLVNGPAAAPASTATAVPSPVLTATPTQRPATPAPAATVNPLSVVKALEDAYNRYDIEAYISLFADQFVARLTGDLVITTTRALRNTEFPYSLGLEGKIQMSACQVKENVVACVVTLRNDCMDGPEQIPLSMTLQEGKIRELDMRSSNEQNRARFDSLAVLGGWATKQGIPEWSAFDELWKMGSVSRTTGALLLSVCRQYKGMAVPTPRPLREDEKTAINLLAEMLNTRMPPLASALFVDDGLFFIWSGALTTGSTQMIQDWLGFLQRRDAKFMISDCRARGETIDCMLEWRDDNWKCFAGQDGGRFYLTVKLRGAEIQLFDMNQTGDTLKALGLFRPAVVAWLSANRPDEWNEYSTLVMAGNYNATMGRLETSICKAYLEAKKK